MTAVLPLALLLFAADPEAARRLAAAYVLGRAKAAAAQSLPRLREDPDPPVRCAAAESLLRHGDRRGLPVLVALIADGPTTTAWQADDLLRRRG
jgi:HEAT repeat protein